MRYQTVLTVTLFGLLLASSPVRSDDVEGLRASFEREIAALNARDLDALMDNQHEQVIALSAAPATPVAGKAARRSAYETLFANTESVTVTPKDPQFRVIDNTGVVWGEYSIAAKPKDNPLTTTSARFSRTYVRTEGNWFLLLYHVSPFPPPPQ